MLNKVLKNKNLKLKMNIVWGRWVIYSNNISENEDFDLYLNLSKYEKYINDNKYRNEEVDKEIKI